ncbi:MAG: choice-of-anchor R domain-containing protein [Pirellulaceae bacterium]
MRLFHASIAYLFAVVICHEIAAQSPLYDNTDLVLGEGERLAHPNIVWMFAQPFRTDEQNTTIRAIELAIGRVGQPEGELQLSIWNESDGLPGQLVNKVGTIDDFASLPFVARGQPVLETTSFDVLIDLEPNSTYFLHLDLSDAVSTEGIGNNLVNECLVPLLELILRHRY